MSEVLSSIKKAMQHLRNSFEEAKKAQEVLSGGPADFHLDRMIGYIDALFTRCDM